MIFFSSSEHVRLQRLLFLSLAMLFVACGSNSSVSRDVGARCDRTSECTERCLPPTTYSGGFCTLACESSDACPGTSLCADIDSSISAEAVDGVCLFSCAQNEDCTFLGAGWECDYKDILPRMEKKVCVPED